MKADELSRMLRAEPMFPECLRSAMSTGLMLAHAAYREAEVAGLTLFWAKKDFHALPSHAACYFYTNPEMASCRRNRADLPRQGHQIQE